MRKPLTKKLIKSIEKILNFMEKELGEKLNKIEGDIEEIKTDVGIDTKSIEEIKTNVAINKTNIQQGFKETNRELSKIKARIDETYNAVDGFIKIGLLSGQRRRYLYNKVFLELQKCVLPPSLFYRNDVYFRCCWTFNRGGYQRIGADFFRLGLSYSSISFCNWIRWRRFSGKCV